MAATESESVTAVADDVTAEQDTTPSLPATEPPKLPETQPPSVPVTDPIAEAKVQPITEQTAESIAESPAQQPLDDQPPVNQTDMIETQSEAAAVTAQKSTDEHVTQSIKRCRSNAC